MLFCATQLGDMKKINKLTAPTTINRMRNCMMISAADPRAENNAKFSHIKMSFGIVWAFIIKHNLAGALCIMMSSTFLFWSHLQLANWDRHGMWQSRTSLRHTKHFHVRSSPHASAFTSVSCMWISRWVGCRWATGQHLTLTSTRDSTGTRRTTWDILTSALWSADFHTRFWRSLSISA